MLTIEQRLTQELKYSIIKELDYRKGWEIHVHEKQQMNAVFQGVNNGMFDLKLSTTTNIPPRLNYTDTTTERLNEMLRETKSSQHIL